MQYSSRSISSKKQLHKQDITLCAARLQWPHVPLVASPCPSCYQNDQPQRSVTCFSPVAKTAEVSLACHCSSAAAACCATSGSLSST
jgi:hypothetical protein